MTDDAPSISIIKISLTRSHNAWVKRQVASGGYADGSACICLLIANDQKLAVAGGSADHSLSLNAPSGSQHSHLLMLDRAAAGIAAEEKRRGFSDKKLQKIIDDVSG